MKPNARNWRLTRLALALCGVGLLAHPLAVRAQCLPAPTAGADAIACSGTRTTTLDALAGDDTVNVAPSANIAVSGPTSAVTAIVAGSGADIVSNQGSVTATASNIQSQSPTLSLPAPGFGVIDAPNVVTAVAAGISGGDGNDALGNVATLGAAATARGSSVSMPLTIFGGDTVNANTLIQATATGVRGDVGTDSVSNAGSLIADTHAEVTSINVEHNVVDLSHGHAKTLVQATATGLSGGAGAGSVVSNSGTIDASADARSLSVTVEINAADAATIDSALTVESNAAGMQGGTSGGTIDNTGAIAAFASTQVLDVGVNASYLDLTITDRDTSAVSTTLRATAAGIDAGASAGALSISHSGSIDAAADSNVHALGIALASEGVPSTVETLVTQFGLASAGIFSNTAASGIAGGSAADSVASNGSVSAHANSNARQDSINVGMALITYPVPTPGIVLGSAGTEASAIATGLDGGAGNDTLTSNRQLTANADASAAALTVSLNLSGFTDNSLGGKQPIVSSVGASVAAADTTTKAIAASSGMQAGDGDDTVLNNNNVVASANADSGSTSVAATLQIEFKEGENLFSGNATGARAVTVADATTTGIGGAGGNDALSNAGSVTASAEADANTVSAAITVGGTVKGKGGALNLAATDTSGIATAAAVGVDGGAANDTLLNSGSILATTDADARNVSVAVSIGFAKQGLVADVSLARSESIATATSAGIGGGDGGDAVTNTGAIDAQANSAADAISVSVALSGTADGVSVSGALAIADGQALAAASGIDGGAGSDQIANNGAISTRNVRSDADAASISVAVSGTNNGVAAGVTLADSSATASALAQGIMGGDGNDGVINRSSVLIEQVGAQADALSIGVTLNAAVNAGVAAGASMADASVSAQSIATGIDGGAGDDALSNQGSILIRNVDAAAAATSVAITATLSMAGVAAGAAFADTGANAITTVAGIAGGSGDDTLRNSGSIAVQGNADVAAASIGVTINAALGLGGGAQIAEAGSTATANATGIAGGTGRDDVYNSGTIAAVAAADAEALAISIGVTLAAGGDATAADATNSAFAMAAGIDDAADVTQSNAANTIDNAGAITVSADARTAGVSAAGNLRGLVLGDTTSNATAEAFGIRSAEGASLVHNRSTLSATSFADASGLSIAATLAGKAVGNADTVAAARSTGVSAGAGNDQVENDAAISALAASQARATSVAVQLAGSTRTEIQTQSQSTATGIDGGDGADVLLNRAAISASADAGANAFGVSASIAGSAGADARLQPIARAAGLAGAGGSDQISALGTLNVLANAHASVANTGWVIAGSSNTAAGTDAQAYATGLDGGSGDDTLLQRGSAFDVRAVASTQLLASSFSFAGTANGSGTLDANATAAGLAGGAGADALRNESAMAVSSRSVLLATGGSNAIFGNASSNTTVGANAAATGLAGGADDDRIDNLARIDASSTSVVTSNTVSFSFAGSPRLDELLKSKAESTGLDAGTGNNQVYNSAQLVVSSLARATTNGGARADIAGSASAAGSALAEGRATGIAAGDGSDRIENSGNLVVTATVAPRANNSSAAGFFFSNGETRASVAGTLSASGIDAGGGDNLIVNGGNIAVSAVTLQDAATLSAYATANAEGSDFSFVSGGHARARGDATVTADAAGIRAGNGNNTVTHTGSIGVNVVQALAASFIDPNGGPTGGYGDGVSNAAIAALGSGIDLGLGNHSVASNGSITVTVGPRSSAGADADGGFDKSSSASSTSDATARAFGIRTGDGNYAIASNAAVQATAAPSAEAWVDSDSSGQCCGANGWGQSINRAEAVATGIVTGNGSGRIDNNALLRVSASPMATPTYTGHGSPLNIYAGGYSSGDADAYVTAQSTATAIGISTGAGSHLIANNSTIRVLADPFAKGAYWTDPGGLGSSNAELHVSATATAVGVTTAGAGSFINRGELIVEALPTIVVGFTAEDGGPKWSLHAGATSTGVQAVSGNPAITNQGLIRSVARGYSYFANNGAILSPAVSNVFPTARGIFAIGNGNMTVVNHGTIDVAVSSEVHLPLLDALFLDREGLATGIRTGSGADSITNNGTILTGAISDLRVYGSSGPLQFQIDTSDIAIDTREGDDTVRLGGASVTTGHIDLGSGNNTLMLTGTPVLNGDIRQGSGTFSLELEGAGNFSRTLPSAASLIKRGAGTYTLAALRPVQLLRVDQGTLMTQGNYTFSSTGLFQTGIHGDGSNGRLAVAGTAELRGGLNIANNGGIYLPGTFYDVVTAGGGITAGSAFSSIQLPTATALLGFHLEQTGNRVRIVSDVASLSSFGSNANDRAAGSYLDNVLLAGSGNLAPLVAALQARPVGQSFADVYSSLNSAPHAESAIAALRSGQRFNNVLLSCRVRDGEQFFVREGDCSWGRVLGRTASSEASADSAASKENSTELSVGGQFAIHESWHAGVGLSYESGKLSVTNLVRSEGERWQFGGIVKTLYGAATYSLAVSAGEGRNATRRIVSLALPDQAASSEQKISFLSSQLRAGYAIERDNSYIRPSLGLSWNSTRVAAFSESGAGVLNLNVQQQNASYTSVQPSVEFGAQWQRASGTLIRPYATIGAFHYLGDPSLAVSASVQGAPTSVAPFIVQRPFDRTYATLTLGADVIQSGGKVVRLYYDRQFSSDTSAHAFSLKVSVPF